MSTIEIILSVLSGLGLTGSTLLGVLFHRAAHTRIETAKAEKAENEASQQEWNLEHQRLEETHQTIMTLNNIINQQGETIARNNKALDEKTVRIREAQEREFESNRRQAELAEENTRLTRENGELKLRLQKHECVKLACIHRDPPNEHTHAARAREKTDMNKNNPETKQ